MERPLDHTTALFLAACGNADATRAVQPGGNANKGRPVRRIADRSPEEWADLGGRVRRRLRELELSVFQFCAAHSITSKTVRLYLAGKGQELSPRSLRRLAGFLGVTQEWLWGRGEQPGP